MKAIAQEQFKKILPILMSALLAGAITFFQNLLAHAGGCPESIAPVETSVALGGAIKAIHSLAKAAENVRV